MDSQKVIIPPFLGEFGVMVIDHLRYVHSLSTIEKIICCEPGQECLFPSASAYFTDYTNPIDDADRCNTGPWRLRPEYLERVDVIYRQLVGRYPDVPIITPEYAPRLRSCANVKFRPSAPKCLSPVDVAICPRYREFAPEKNWPHWIETVGRLKAEGLTVGIAGSESTCFALDGDAFAWHHPQGPTSGCVDMLAHCRMYLGPDTGVSHLAALMDTPQVVFGFWNKDNPNQTNLMQLSNRRHCRVMLDGWTNPAKLIAAVNDYLL